MNYDAILFDLDGTLLNTLEDLRDSVNFAMESLGLPTHDLKTIRSFVGNGIRKTLQRSLPPDSSNETLDKAFAKFQEYYNDNMTVKTRPFDGIIELLERIHSQYKLAIVSNKAEWAVKHLNEHYFAEFGMLPLGDRDGRARKPDPQIVFDALNILNATRALYIGDSKVDIETAHASGLDLICVSWGFADKADLLNVGAEKIVDHPSEILHYL